MNEYRFLCPKCGRGFTDGAANKKCPQCQVPLLEAGANWAAEFGELRGALDLDELLRKALADQKSGEDIDRALTRVIANDFPDSQRAVLRLVEMQITEWQRTRRLSRQEAVKELAEGDSEMVVGPGGHPEIRTEVRTQTRVFDLENLSSEQREEALQQIQQLLESGSPSRRVRVSTQIGGRRIGCGTSVVVIGAIAIGWWAGWG